MKMKVNLLLCGALILISYFLPSIAHAQSPSKMSYQAVIRNSNNALVTHASVGMQISILQGSESGMSVYTERHFPKTNANGLASLEIGGGVIVSGNFDGIDWTRGPYFIKTETDLNGGANYTITGTSQLLSVPYALLAERASRDSDNQLLNLAGNTLSISGGNQVTLPEPFPYRSGPGIQIDGATISNTGDLSSTNEIQSLSLMGQTLSLSPGGGSVSLPQGLALPYSGSTLAAGAAAFQVTNSSNSNGISIYGRHGDGSTIGMLNSGAVFGSSRQGYGVVGYSSASGPVSGILGRSDNATGTGVYGYGSNGAKGGFFETAGSGAALATGAGNVGIGVSDPDVKLEVNGVMRVNTNVGRMELGFPGGDKWYFSTLDGGESLVLSSQLAGEAANQRIFFNKEGRVAVGSASPEGRLKIYHNSTVRDPHLMLTENATDYSRISFKNQNSDHFWSVAGFINNGDSSQDRLNFYNDRAGDVLSINGKGIVGIRTISPISDLHLIHREIKDFATESGRMGLRLQNAGTGGNFWNLYVQNANGNLELYFKNALKGYFNDASGVYTSASDERLKKDILPLGSVLGSVLQLQPKRYRFLEQDSHDPETLGFLAQDVQRLFPELVQHSGDGGADVYTMDYAGFGIVAIRAIQEQQQVIEQQQKTIEQLLIRMETLEKKCAKLDKQ